MHYVLTHHLYMLSKPVIPARITPQSYQYYPNTKKDLYITLILQDKLAITFDEYPIFIYAAFH